jgi:hypothetical protein
MYKKYNFSFCRKILGNKNNFISQSNVNWKQHYKYYEESEKKIHSERLVLCTTTTTFKI